MARGATRRVVLKILPFLLVILLCNAPLHAEQALVMTEIERLQEALWYLQRDIAAQATALKEHKEQLGLLAGKTDRSQTEMSERLAAMVMETADRQQRTLQMETQLQGLREDLAALGDELRRQKELQQELALQSTAQDGLLQALRTEFAAQQSRDAQAFNDIRGQLLENRSRLESFKQGQASDSERLVLWGGGAVLLLTILVTLGLAVRKNTPRRRSEDFPPKHEL